MFLYVVKAISLLPKVDDMTAQANLSLYGGGGGRGEREREGKGVSDDAVRVILASSRQISLPSFS